MLTRTLVFFTYMINAPIMVYGVANLILSLVSVGGIFIFITVNRPTMANPTCILTLCFLIAGRSTCPLSLACYLRVRVHRACGRICQSSDIHHRSRQLPQSMCQRGIDDHHQQCQQRHERHANSIRLQKRLLQLRQSMARRAKVWHYFLCASICLLCK